MRTFMRPGHVFFFWGLLVTVGLIIHKQPDKSLSSHACSLKEVEPDDYFKKISLTRFTAQGKPHSRLQSDYVQDFFKKNTTVLTTPRIEFFGDCPISISSENGVWNNRNEILFLKSQVLLEQGPCEGRPGFLAKTHSLRYDTLHERASSSDPIILERGPLHVEGLGIRFSLPNSTLDILSEVQLNYAVY